MLFRSVVTNSATDSTRSEFQYDGLFRRRVRKEFKWQGGTFVPIEEVRYVYDGRLPIQERDGYNVPLVTYTRGTDLSGSREGAGGIGGLLARTDQTQIAPTHAYYHADGNGNVTALIDVQQRVAARYIFDPYGNTLAMSGSLAEANLYRFSSKEAHPASGLVYYLYRYYDPNLQRWVNRDPSGERGGISLYRFGGNAPINRLDPFGLADCSKNSYLVIENATGLLGEWFESDAERSGARLGMDEGFENKWSEKPEILQTLRTAGSDDIVAFFGHSLQINHGPACGIVANSDWPFYEALGGDPMSAASLAEAINNSPGAPSVLIFASCLSDDFTPSILDSTSVNAILGLNSKVGLGEARELLSALLGNMTPDRSLQEAVDRANSQVPHSSARWLLKTKLGCESTPLGILLGK